MHKLTSLISCETFANNQDKNISNTCYIVRSPLCTIRGERAFFFFAAFPISANTSSTFCFQTCLDLLQYVTGVRIYFGINSRLSSACCNSDNRCFMALAEEYKRISRNGFFLSSRRPCSIPSGVYLLRRSPPPSRPSICVPSLPFICVSTVNKNLYVVSVSCYVRVHEAV